MTDSRIDISLTEEDWDKFVTKVQAKNPKKGVAKVINNKSINHYY